MDYFRIIICSNCGKYSDDGGIKLKRITVLRRLKSFEIAFILYGLANCHKMKTCGPCPIYRSNLPRICFRAKVYDLKSLVEYLNEECGEHK